MVGRGALVRVGANNRGTRYGLRVPWPHGGAAQIERKDRAYFSQLYVHRHGRREKHVDETRVSANEAVLQGQV